MLRILPIIFLFITQFLIATHVHFDCDESSPNSECVICQVAMQSPSLQAKDIKILNDPIKEFVFNISYFVNNSFNQRILNSNIKNKAPPRI